MEIKYRNKGNTLGLVGIEVLEIPLLIKHVSHYENRRFVCYFWLQVELMSSLKCHLKTQALVEMMSPFPKFTAVRGTCGRGEGKVQKWINPVSWKQRLLVLTRPRALRCPHGNGELENSSH